MDLFEKCYETNNAKLMRDAGLYLYFHEMNSRQDAVVMMEGKRKIMLGSNNYLGLTSNPELVEVGIHTLEKYGTGCGGSRILNGTMELHTELENEIASFLHKEDAIVFAAGFQTNIGIISSLVGLHDYVISDKENHASIYDGCRLSNGKMLTYKHSDMQDLEIQLQKVPETSGCLIVTDGVFSMGGDIAKLPEICTLAKKYGARVMVDDAHALGVIGVGGRGTASHFGLEDQVDIIMGTLSKSLASIGGYVAGDAQVVDYIKNQARSFMFATGLPPVNTAIALAALRHIEAHPEIVQKLMDLAYYARESFRRKDVPTIKSSTPIIPVLTYDTLGTLSKASKCFPNGVYINAVLPPACAEGMGLLRASCMATLTKPLIDEATDIIADVVLYDE